jgi:hypothetical protein
LTLFSLTLTRSWPTKEDPAMTTTPNGYGQMAMGHMAEYLPVRYAEIDDPDSHFRAVGEEVLREINEAMTAWERAQPADQGLRNMTRLAIEEMVLGELVFLTPESDPSEPEIDEWGVCIGPTPGMGEWDPIWGAGLTQEDLDEMDEENSRTA